MKTKLFSWLTVLALFASLRPAAAQTLNITGTAADPSVHFWHYYGYDGSASLQDVILGGDGLVSAFPSQINLTGVNTISVTWSAPAGEMFVVNAPPAALGPLTLEFFSTYGGSLGSLSGLAINSTSTSYGLINGTAPGNGSLNPQIISSDLLSFDDQFTINPGDASLAFTNFTVTVNYTSSSSLILNGYSGFDQGYFMTLANFDTSDTNDPGRLLTLQPLPNSFLNPSNYNVDWFKVAGGGGTSTGGVYTVTGTFGQPDAGGPMNGGGYSVEGGFWSLFAVQSSSAIGNAPVITQQPRSLFITNGTPVTFDVSVSGTPPFYYQWQLNGTNLTDGGTISGSTTTNLSLDTSLFNVGGNYSVIIENAYGSVTDSVASLRLILPAYSITDLGTLGGTYSYAFGINNSGQVVGYSYVTGNNYVHAFSYSGGTMNDLGTLGGNSSYAQGINNNGQVVGYSSTASGYVHAFSYSGGTMNDLGTLGGTSSYAQGINNNGQVIGYSDMASGYVHAFSYSGGTMNDLGTLGGTYSYAFGINNSGQVVGYSDMAGGYDHAFSYSGGTMNDLGTLDGTYSYAFGINNSGQVVGDSFTASRYVHAFSYSGGTMNDLGTLGGTYSYAFGINNSGQVVGYSFTASGYDHAFLYSGGMMFDLNNLVNTNFGTFSLYEATGINDSGQIIAIGDNNHAYLLTPISPATYLAENLTPKIQSPNLSHDGFQFTWNVLNTYPAVGYEVQTTTNLTSPNWINLGPVLTGTGPTLSATDTISTNAQRFYRVLLVQ